MSKETETPLTDAHCGIREGDDPENFFCTVKFARDLERQLSEAKRDTERLEWLTKGISEEWNPETREYFKHIPIPYIPCMIGESSRQAIDTAMKEDSQ